MACVLTDGGRGGFHHYMWRCSSENSTKVHDPAHAFRSSATCTVTGSAEALARGPNLSLQIYYFAGGTLCIWRDKVVRASQMG